MDAQDAVSRRRFVAGVGALLAAGCQPTPRPTPDGTAAAPVLAAGPTVDIHSHAGHFMAAGRASEPVAGPMRAGGLSVACLAVPADNPVVRLIDRRLQAVRAPEPGELNRYATAAFGRILTLAREQGLGLVTTTAELDAARTAGPAIIMAAEGGDFLEGALGRLEEFHLRLHLRHLQLTHYRANEIGDIQTEAPVHDGLSAFGVEVVRACNRLGIVIDVAHAPYDMVTRVAALSDRPLVLSHTSLSASPGARSRLITRDHARAVADTGGVIGVWPPSGIFATRDAFVAGIARMVDAAGIDHVGIGSDLRGLPLGSVFDDYAGFSDIAARLLAAGFDTAAAAKILGGNYRRVFAATVG